MYRGRSRVTLSSSRSTYTLKSSVSSALVDNYFTSVSTYIGFKGIFIFYHVSICVGDNSTFGVKFDFFLSFRVFSSIYCNENDRRLYFGFFISFVNFSSVYFLYLYLYDYYVTGIVFMTVERFLLLDSLNLFEIFLSID